MHVMPRALGIRFFSENSSVCSQQMDDMPVFEIVRTMECYFTGAIIVAPAELWKTLCGSCSESLPSILSAAALSTTVRRYFLWPTGSGLTCLNSIRLSIFFSPIKKCGDAHLTSVHKKSSPNSLKSSPETVAKRAVLPSAAVVLEICRREVAVQID